MASFSSPTPTQPITPNQPCSNDTCSNCRNRGHLAEDCPFKTPQKSQTPKSLSSSSSFSSSPNLNFPPLSCPKGHGSCLIRVSKTPTNPGKQFYTCNFYSSNRDRTQDYPDCRCQAGKCKIIQENGLQFYVCPITKGHGACSFRTAVINDTDTSTIVNSDLNSTDSQTTSLSSPKRAKVGSTVTDNPGPSSTTPVDPGPCLEQTIVPYKDSDDNITESRELVNFTAEKEIRVSRPPVEVVRHRQTEFLRQISADQPQQFIGTLISGWLGRLAFPPSESPIVSQPKPFFCCVFPSFDPIWVPKGVTDFNPRDLNDPSQQISTRNSQSQGVLSTIQQEGDFTRQISKYLLEAGLFIQSQLLAILESTEPSNHSSMEEAASAVFAVLDRLSVDHSSFAERVKEFISRSKSLANIQEESMKGTKEEIMGRYENQRAEFLDISRIHSETVDAVAESDRRLKLLGEEASLLKALLLRIESQSRQLEAENEEIKTREGKISEELVQSEIKFREAEAEKKLLEEMEAKRKAALEALELAKVQLRNSVTVSI